MEGEKKGRRKEVNEALNIKCLDIEFTLRLSLFAFQATTPLTDCVVNLAYIEFYFLAVQILWPFCYGQGKAQPAHCCAIGNTGSL